MPLEPFIDKVLTANYTDTIGMVSVKNQYQAMIYLTYAKGTEEYLLILPEFSTRSDPSVFFAESCYVGNPVVLIQNEIRVNAAGSYRIPIPNSLQEEVLRISAKAFNPGGSPGTVKFYHHNSRYLSPPVIEGS